MASAPAPTLSRELQAEVMQTVLSDGERNLLRMVAGGGINRALGLYRNTYGDKAGVEAEVTRIRQKVEVACARRADRQLTRETPLEEQVRAVEPPAAEDETPATGNTAAEIVKRMAAGLPGRIGGAGAAGDAAKSATPPIRSAPAPSADPSPAVLDTPAASPAVKEPVQAAVQSGGVAPSRGAQIEALLRVRRMSTKALAAELGITDQQGKQAVLRLEARRVIEKSVMNAYDWPGAKRGGRPSRVWKLVEEPEGVLMPVVLANSSTPAQAQKPAATRRRPVVSQMAPAEMCEHDVPRRLCRVCSPAPDGAPFEPAEISPGEFDARKLWESLSPERQKLLVQLVVREVMIPAVSAALDA